MHRVLVNVASSDWAVHFIAPDGKTRIGPWLLHDSHDEVLKILAWCGITEEELEEHHSAIRRWGCSSAVVWLTDAKLAVATARRQLSRLVKKRAERGKSKQKFPKPHLAPVTEETA